MIFEPFLYIQKPSLFYFFILHNNKYSINNNNQNNFVVISLKKKISSIGSPGFKPNFEKSQKS